MKVIFEHIFEQYFKRFSSSAFSILLMGFLALSFLSINTNLIASKKTEIRDVASFTSKLDEKEKLSLNKSESTIASNFAPSVPRTSSSVASSYTNTSPGNGSLSYYNIVNPRSTGDCSYIAPNETGALSCNGGNFFFGHSHYAFSWIRYIGEGETFSVTRNGATETYRVARKISMPLNEVERYYRSISQSLMYRGETYSAILMTCGRGDDDNNYRTFVFAYRV